MGCDMLSEGRQRLTPFSPQIVIQVFVVVVVFGVVDYLYPVKSGNGLDCLLPGEVVIQITMDENILLQFQKTLFQVAYGVHHKKIGRDVNTYVVISLFMQH